MELHEQAQAIARKLHMVNDADQLGRLQDQLLSMVLSCAHWRRSLNPGRTLGGLTASHLALTSKERIAARKKLLEDAQLDVYEFSLVAKTGPSGAVVTQAVCLSNPSMDASQFVGVSLSG
ncbi:MAG: hypothetical protein AB8B96_16150 [Lysobacterales bacterium]